MVVQIRGKKSIDWKNGNSIWSTDPNNDRLVPGGSEYARYEWVRDQIAPRCRVLDVGCNCGQVAVNLTNDLDCLVCGVDIVPEFIEHIRSGKNRKGVFLCMDFSRGEMPSDWKAYFDVVTALEVIEHPIDVRGFRDNVLEVLKPGGKLIVTTPYPDSLGYRYMYTAPAHVRMWTRWRLEHVFGPAETFHILHRAGTFAQMGAVFK